jgi:hypothetical protein
MTARQKEIQTLCEGILICKKLIAEEEKQYALAVSDVASGLRGADSTAPAFYRNSINETKGWLARDEARLALLLEQEARS